MTDSGDMSGDSKSVSPVFGYFGNKTQFWSAINSKASSGQGVTAKDLNEYKGKDGESLLHAAIKADNKDIVDELIKKGVNLYAVDKDGKTPLHYAIEKGDDKLAQQLFELAPDAIEIGDNDNNKNPLHYAAEKGNIQLVRAMAEKFPLMIENGDLNGKTPLHHAIEQNNIGVAQELFNLSPGAAKLQDKQGKTPLHYAVEQNNIGVAQELFNLSPGAAKLQDKQGKTPLHYAVEAGRSDFVGKIITKDPSLVDIADKDGKTPLHHAAEKRKVKSAEALLVPFNGKTEKLKEIITKPSGISPNNNGPSAGELLIIAYAEKKNAQEVLEPNFPEMIKLLEMAPELASNEKVKLALTGAVDAEGKNILHYLDSAGPILTGIVTAAPKLATQLDTKYGKSPLHYAAEKGDVELVSALGNNNRENAVAHQDKNGNNLLHIAAAKGHKQILEMIVNNSDVTSLTAVNKDGKTPRQVAKGGVADLLHAQEHKLAIEAAKTGDIKALDALLKNNENLLNAKDTDGYTLLHHGAMSGHSSIVSSLLDKGADITASDEKGQSARAVVGGGNEEEATKCADAIGAKEKQAIFAAVENGDKDLVKKLLEQNPGLVQEKDGQRRTLLHIAAEKGYTEILKSVIDVIPESDKDSLINGKDTEGQTSLHYASENLHEASKAMLIDKGAKIDTKNGNQKTAEDLGKQALLLKQVRDGNLKEVQSFLDNQYNREFIISAKDKDSKSVLHIAAEMGHTEIALAIIKSNPELAEQIDKKGRTPYHYSAAEGHNDVSNALVNTKGADTADEKIRKARKDYENIKDEDGKIADNLFKEFQVIKAVREGKTQELTDRLTKEPDLISAKDKDGNNLLHIAIASNQMEIVGELVKKRPELMEEKNKDGKTPIETALEKSDESAFHQVMGQVEVQKRKELLSEGVDKNNGLYHQALAQGKLEHAEIMLFFLDNKEDRLAIVAMPNKEGKNLLHLAAEKDSKQVISNVLNLVEDVTNEQLVALLTAQDKNGDTPLHSAAKAGNREIFEAFAEKVGAANGINLNELEKILEEVEKKKIREIEALAKETAAENAKSASAQNISQQAASSNQSHEQKGAAYSKEDFLKGAIDSVKFTPCTGEEKKFNSNNQRAMSDPAATHLSERRNEDGSFSYKLNIVEPNSPTKLHKIEGQFGELIFNGAGEMIGAEIKDPSKLNLLGKEQREQALKLNEEKDQGMTKASVVENLGQPLVAQQQQAKTQATPASILSAPAAAANALPRQGSANIPSSYPSEQQQVPGQRQGGQSDGRGRREAFNTGLNFSESELDAAAGAVAARRETPAGAGGTKATPAGPALAHRGGVTKATPAVPAAAQPNSRAQHLKKSMSGRADAASTSFVAATGRQSEHNPGDDHLR